MSFILPFWVTWSWNNTKKKKVETYQQGLIYQCSLHFETLASQGGGGGEADIIV